MSPSRLHDLEPKFYPIFASQWIKGRGLDINVPLFLRYDGLIKCVESRHITLSTYEKLIYLDHAGIHTCRKEMLK